MNQKTCKNNKTVEGDDIPPLNTKATNLERIRNLRTVNSRTTERTTIGFSEVLSGLHQRFKVIMAIPKTDLVFEFRQIRTGSIMDFVIAIRLSK